MIADQIESENKEIKELRPKFLALWDEHKNTVTESEVESDMESV
jgi:hypothetical protein